MKILIVLIAISLWIPACTGQEANSKVTPSPSRNEKPMVSKKLSPESGAYQIKPSRADTTQPSPKERALMKTNPGVPQKSSQSDTSSSGSPSILSDDNGTGPDGTNTRQRSTLNIAGSPLPEKDRLPIKDPKQHTVEEKKQIIDKKSQLKNVKKQK